MEEEEKSPGQACGCHDYHWGNKSHPSDNSDPDTNNGTPGADDGQGLIRRSQSDSFKEERHKREGFKNEGFKSKGFKGEGFKGERMVVLPTELFAEYAAHPQVRRLYLTDVGFFPEAAHHYRERKVGIEEYIFFYCMKGSGTIKLDGQEYTLRENDAFCIPHFTPHVYYAHKEDPWSILWVHFKGEDTAYLPLKERRIVHFSSEYAANHMQFLFDLLFRALDSTYTLGNFIYISQVLSLILAETYQHDKEESESTQDRYITDVIHYMYQHLDQILTLEEISREFAISPSYLNIIFQRSTQKSPISFFLSLKMKEACFLLRSTDKYIYEIARELGYSDQYYFSRIFKKTVGISPRQYRDSDYVIF